MATLGNCPFAGRSFVPFSSSNRQQNRNGHKSNRTVTRTVSARRRASFDKSAPFGSVQRGPNEWRHGPTSMLNAPRRLVDTVVKILREWSGSIRPVPYFLFFFFFSLLRSSWHCGRSEERFEQLSLLRQFSFGKVAYVTVVEGMARNWNGRSCYWMCNEDWFRKVYESCSKISL